jgi:putative oxidoreductase
MKIALRILNGLCRNLLGVAFLYSGYIKIHEPLQFAVTITGYKLVPEGLVFPLATYFPWVEILLGLLLLNRWKVSYVAAGAAALLLFFITILTITYMRGIEANCGCFSFSDRISPKTIMRDGLLLLPAIFLIIEDRFRVRRKYSDLADPVSSG